MKNRTILLPITLGQKQKIKFIPFIIYKWSIDIGLCPVRNRKNQRMKGVSAREL
jgi:hypothetical protein